MGKIVLAMSVSADGFFEGPNREIDWHLVDDELHRHFNEYLKTASAFLDGRVTYELMADFWPTADADPATGHVEAEFARIWRETPKIVFSRTLRQAEWSTTIKREVVAEEVRALRARSGGDLALGGANLAATFRDLDLIDEYRLYVHPVLIGRGHRLFRDADTMTSLELIETRTFGSGVVLLRYQRSGSR
ncbi:dihydrofolate reductase family protein [Actinokineospora iranica]|uniref:Dihydrofolate reductase n=1 Tax=Actinokineospora iranica TaxID=1271860 RepID=A0A1G6J569_9PSEU|nr:dihydrofolate reductase family protein [Actinokineospora iranica]SDC13116.1 Dihydrofolate reductase [Actinokineospora iranica]